MKKLRELQEQDKPREKIAHQGACALSDHELIACIIGRGTVGRDVLQVSRDISRLFSDNPDGITYADLVRIPGVGQGKASQILASMELARRYLRHDEEIRVKVQTPADILPLVADLNGRRQEHFICITLNGANEVIATRTVTVGLLNHSLVHPREVFADAITDRAAAVICVHNHPSGTLEPSSQDLAITRQLKDAGELLGIRLLDHLIVARTGYLSLKERGLL
ncbi:MAG: DNA repair protein RadC [Methanolinea sp.]|jgi:DNA repair protein RadC|nr:DNA repair protein RadC [Methanolinea sp.]